FRALGKLLRYLVRRARRQPIIGLLYALIGLPCVCLLVAHLMAWRSAMLAAEGKTPSAVWFLSTPLPAAWTWGLVGMLGIVVGLDLLAAICLRHKQARKAAEALPEPERCVLGRGYNR